MLLWVLEWREGGREGGIEGGFILSFHSFLTSLLLLYSCEDSAVDLATCVCLHHSSAPPLLSTLSVWQYQMI